VRHLVEQIAGVVRWEVKARVGVDSIEKEGNERIVPRLWIHGFVGLSSITELKQWRTDFIR